MGSAIRYLAVAISVVVALAFLLFAVDELRNGSEAQQRAVAQEGGASPAVVTPVSPAPAEELSRERQHGSVREAIDDANDVLLAPFKGLVDSQDSWVTHGVPALLALLVYGLGLGVLANSLPAACRGDGDWRAAT